MADVTELRMNVTALKRVDPYAKDIIETARHVAFYSFNSEENEWERTNIEGALFIYSRNGEPYHGILIINRLNTNNLVEPVVRGLDLQLQEPFLLYRNSSNKIRGFWFYDREDCLKVAQLLQRLISEIQSLPSVSSVEEMSQNQNTANESVDIFSMLSRAQEDFNIYNNQASSVQHETTLHNKPDVTSKSVIDFFAKATTSSQANVPAFAAPRVAEPLNPDQHLLHRLMSNPVTVEHIEKQQRSVTPQDTKTTTTERRIFPMQPLSTSTMTEMPSMTIAQPPGISGGDHKPVLIDNGLSFMRISSPNQGASSLNAFFCNKGMGSNVDADSRPLSAPLCNLEASMKPALMPPTMFTSSASADPSHQTSIIEQGDMSIRPEPLTRNQLLQAVTYLLKTDSEFVNKLHEAYVKSFNDIIH